ncbi:MAG: hypothetical protein QUS14_06235 [Pyrinomonadaceae bacterium]|nr:hypothetical protein [Pyrinomonadaceae bacterium]
MTIRHFRFVHLYTLTLLIALLVLTGTADAQKRKKGKAKKAAAELTGRPVMWEPVDIDSRDLFYGPGGRELEPDLSRVTFIKKESGGANKKYRIRDAAGRIWIAKLGIEARPETAAVRLLHGLGYKTEINYLVPTLRIPGKGTFRNVRLELRPDNVDRKGEWKWKQNRFSGTQELQGLKIMQIFMTNWDVLDKQNEILEVQTPRGKELHYVISDLGRTFGKYGNNNLPIIYRLGRKTGNPKPYSKASFIKGFDDDGRIRWGIKGKNRGIYRDVTVGDARWLLDKLSRLSDSQIADAFRAANYSPAEVDMYRTAVKRRIRELRDLVSDDRFARRE